MVATVALTPVGRAGGCSGAALCEHPEFLSSGSVHPLIPSFLTNILGPHVAGGAWPRGHGVLSGLLCCAEPGAGSISVHSAPVIIALWCVFISSLDCLAVISCYSSWKFLSVSIAFLICLFSWKTEKLLQFLIFSVCLVTAP